VTLLIKTQFQTLLAYHWYTHTRLFELAAQLNEADYMEQPGYGQGSIHDLFFHLMRTFNSWRRGLETGKRLSPFKAEDFPTFESLQTGFKQEHAAWQALLDRLSDEEIEGDVRLTTRSGEIVDIPRWRILHHLVLHGMQHHAELAHLLTLKGHSPGDIDFIFYQ
jgi:uncharacterized damage-inducible protein DinB